ncbi:hypothetical protein B0H10DRAFT_1813822, partial [Mycena sp. CBHHK59/15]
DTALAIQAVSCFALTYLLTTRGSLAPNTIVMSIANTGQSLDDLSVDYLSLRAKLAAGWSKVSLFMDQSKRDSTVLDSFIKELNICYPKYRYFNLFPGLVASEQFDINKLPRPLSILMWFRIRIISTTPDQFANVPVYVSILSFQPTQHPELKLFSLFNEILASPEAQHKLGPSMYYDYKLNPTQLGKWAKDPKNRQACGKS